MAIEESSHHLININNLLGDKATPTGGPKGQLDWQKKCQATNYERCFELVQKLINEKKDLGVKLEHGKLESIKKLCNHAGNGTTTKGWTHQGCMARHEAIAWALKYHPKGSGKRSDKPVHFLIGGIIGIVLLVILVGAIIYCFCFGGGSSKKGRGGGGRSSKRSTKSRGGKSKKSKKSRKTTKSKKSKKSAKK